MISFECCVVALALVGVFVLTASAADPGRPGLTLVGQAAATGATGAVTVDDARLHAELAAAAGRGGDVRFVPDFRRRFSVIRAAKAPAMNGRLDDPAWRNAVILRDFTVSQSFNDTRLPSPAADATEAMVLFDDKGLYVGVRALQDPKTIYTTMKANGWMRPDLDWEAWSEEWANTGCDEIEVAIDPELTMASYYVFHVNPDGVTQKHYMPSVPTEGGSVKRVDAVLVADDRWKAATTRDDKGWCATIFIPFESIAFRPIAKVGAEEIYFDMVQDRTVMGFNINRISHQRHEPSSWSPSKGAMFFRDAGNFGNAYFAPPPATLEKVSFDRVADAVSMSLDLKSRSDKTQTLDLEIRTGSKELSALPKSTLTIASGKSVSAVVPLPASSAGRQFVEVRLVAADTAVVDRARYAYDVPALVEVTVTKTVLFEGETDFPVTLRVNPPAGGADEVRYAVTSSGKSVAQVTGVVPAGSATLPFAVSSLVAGEYEFQAELLKSGKPVGSARQSFRVIPDPWSRALSGKAGDGRGAKGVPAGFAALATSMPDGQAPRPFDGEAPYFDAAMKERGCLVYAMTATADFTPGGRGRRRRASVSPDAFPRRPELDAPIRAFAAGDEYEAVSFAVLALDDLKNPRVAFTELKTTSGAVIPVDQMDLRAERSDMYIVKEASLGDMPKNTARRYFLTVYVAPGTPAGDYRGKITFSAEGRPAVEREYSLLVLPFGLPLSPMVNGIYGGMRGSDDPERDRVVAADLLAHGMNNPTCVSVLKGARMFNVHHLIWDLEIAGTENWLGDGPARFAAPIDEGVLENMKKAGLRGPFVIEVNYLIRYLPCTEENAELFAKAITRIEDARKKYGLDEFAYHLVDEPNNHYTYDDGRYGRRYGIERAKFFGKVMKKLGLRTYVSMNSAGRGYDIGEYLYDELDIWCANFISDEKQIDRWTAGGREVWLYNYAGDGWCKGAGRSTYGFYALRARASGVTIWHHPSYVGWNETEKKVVARAAWDAIREGIDDSRYAALLSSLIEKARKAGGEKARLADAAQKDLDAIVAAYPVPTHEKVAFESLHDASDWNKWRWIVADWILKLM